MAESTGNEPIGTPRRSPRLASKRSAAPSSNILTPVRQSLRKLAGKSTVLDDLKQFIEHTPSYSSLIAQSVTAEVGVNTLRNFLVVSRKVKSYNHQIGPYDAMKLVVKEDGCYILLVFDQSIEEGTVQTPLSSSSILQALNKLAEQTWIFCLPWY